MKFAVYPGIDLLAGRERSNLKVPRAARLCDEAVVDRDSRKEDDEGSCVADSGVEDSSVDAA